MSLRAWASIFIAVSMGAFSSSAQDTGLVAGRVYDADWGTGLEGAVLRAGPGVSAVSDRDGYYVLAGVQPGKGVEVTIDPIEGYAHPTKFVSRSITLEAGQALEGIDFPIQRARVLHGVVIDDRGTPVSGGALTIVWSGPDLKATTAQDGAFSVTGLSAWATFRLDIDAPGLMTTGAEYEMPENGLDGVIVRLVRAARVHAVVVDASGRALSGAQVHYERETGSGNASFPPVTAGGHGVVSFERLLPADYTFFVQHGAGRVQRVLHTTLAPGEERNDVVLTYDPDHSLTISGRVIATDGKPLEGVSMAVIGETMQTRATTNAKGEYIAYDLEEGRYTLTYLERNGHSLDGHLEAYAGETAINFVTEPEMTEISAETVRGRIIDAGTGRPVENARYVLKEGIYDVVHPDPPQARYTGFFQTFYRSQMGELHDPDGRFEMTAYAKGAHTLYVVADGYAAYLGAVTVPNEGLTIALDPECRVDGRILDPGGNPVEGARIMLGPIDWYAPVGPQGDPWARSDGDGWFTLGNLAPGSVALSAWHEAWGSATATVDVTNGAPTEITLTMPETGALVGVVSVDGVATENFGLNIYEADSGEVAYAAIGKVCIQADGSYRVPLLLPGEYRMQLRLDPYRHDEAADLSDDRHFTIRAGEATEEDFSFQSE